MSQEIVKYDMYNLKYSKNSCDVDEEFQDKYFPDNKVCISETTITNNIINLSNSELNKCTNNDKIRKYEILTVDHIKTNLQSPEVIDTASNNVKIEDQICPADLQIKFCSELLFCSYCHEVYQDYCTKCRVLVHILNERHCYNRYNRISELPKHMLETRESIGKLGIFSLKVIPENVRFGPFAGLSPAGLPLRIKGGRFVVGDDKFEHLNWMQYINPARNIYEQNLFPFQYEDMLYYCSTRRIQEGEELLVYFGKEHEDNLLKNVEMDFIPIAKKEVENVFACVFCCLGFRSKEYLAEHKAGCCSATKEIFSVEELAQCPFCKIYMETKEYLEHHKDYCCQTNDRDCVFHSPNVDELELKTRSFERRKVKKWKRGIYKCTQCNFRTIYFADFKHHTNEHYQVKMYKCEICDRRYKARESLNAHVEKNHADNEDLEKYSTSDHFKGNIPMIKERSPHLDDDEKQCQSATSKFQTRNKCHLKSQIKMKHLNRDKYKCAKCEFKTYYRTYLERHMKIKHLMGSNYKRSGCEFGTKYKGNLVSHKNAKHLKANNYKCMECVFKTNYKSNLKEHIKAKHLKENLYKCTECEFKTYYKSHLKVHIKRKHRKDEGYQCTECEYKTNYKPCLEAHIKVNHLKQNDYKCVECEYKTNIKSYLKKHIQRKHLKQNDYNCIDYNCIECEFKTNCKDNLDKHRKRKHLIQRDYECAECEYKAKYKSNLEAHIKAKHLKEYDYNCMECEYKTNIKSYFKKHIKIKHMKQNDYKCTECDYTTFRKSHLDNHRKVKHLNEYDYNCVECEYKTNYKSNLERHMKAKRHNESDYKFVE